MKYEIGQVVVRITEYTHLGMMKGDKDEIVGIYDTVHVNLKKFGIGHSKTSLKVLGQSNPNSDIILK